MSRVVKPLMIFVSSLSLAACMQGPTVIATLPSPSESFTPMTEVERTATPSALPLPISTFTLTATWLPDLSPSVTPTSTFMPVTEMPPGFSPILYGKRYDANTFFALLGGWQGEMWLTPDLAAIYFANLPGWEYDVYSLAAGKFQVHGDALKFSFPHKMYSVGTNVTVDEVGMVGVTKGWPVLQRDVQELSSDNEMYRQVVLDWLAGQGLSVSELGTLHIFRVDLEGDGVDEIFISATHLENQHMTKSGDYSIIIMRKVLGNDTVTLPVVSDVYQSQEIESTLPREYSLGNFLDLNQDGILEVIVDIRRWDGDGAFIYQIDGQNITQVP